MILHLHLVSGLCLFYLFEDHFWRVNEFVRLYHTVYNSLDAAFLPILDISPSVHLINNPRISSNFRYEHAHNTDRRSVGLGHVSLLSLLDNYLICYIKLFISCQYISASAPLDSCRICVILMTLTLYVLWPHAESLVISSVYLLYTLSAPSFSSTISESLTLFASFSASCLSFSLTSDT